MDDFASRAYNKQCEKEYAALMKENDKGITLNGEATGQKGSATFPTDGEPRVLACYSGTNTEDEETNIENGLKAEGE